MTTALQKTEFRTCYICKYEAETDEVKCPKCRKPMQGEQQIRVLGGLLMFIGIILIAVMGFVISFTHKAVSGYDSSVKWNASPEETKMILAVLYLVIVFGLSAWTAGFWHLVSGRRNLKLIWIMLGLGFVLWGLANAVMVFAP